MGERAHGIRVVLFDVDGVIRHWAREPEAMTERHFGLPSGEVRRVAFDNELEERVITGAIDTARWIAEVDAELVRRHGARVRGAGRHFFAANRSEVDDRALSLVRELQAFVTVGLFSNGTDQFEEEMSELDLGEVHLFNAHRLGLAKPDPAAFATVADALGVDPSSVFFTDDKPRNVAAARSAGWRAVDFTGVATLRTGLAAAGVLPL